MRIIIFELRRAYKGKTPQDAESQFTDRVTSKPPPAPALPWQVVSIVIVCCLLMTTGGIIALVHPAMLVNPGQEINGAVRTYAGYLVSRNLAIAAMLLVALFIRARRALSLLMVLTALIQFLDAGVDSLEQRWTVVPGVLVLGILLFLGASRTARYPPWSTGFWRDSRDAA